MRLQMTPLLLVACSGVLAGRSTGPRSRKAGQAADPYAEMSTVVKNLDYRLGWKAPSDIRVHRRTKVDWHLQKPIDVRASSRHSSMGLRPMIELMELGTVQLAFVGEAMSPSASQTLAGTGVH